MQVLVIGGAGQIGRYLTPLLVEQGHTVRAMIRNPEQQDELAYLGAEVVIADLEGDFEHAFEGCNAVVFTAGSGAKTGADKTLLVDVWGALKSIREAQRRGIEHYIMVSSRNAGDPDKGPEAIKHYTVAKHVVDNELSHSPVPHTILRPGRLTNESATGRVTTVRPADQEAQVITRDDVAHAISYCLQQAHTIGHIYELYQGDEPLESALGTSNK